MTISHYISYQHLRYWLLMTKLLQYAIFPAIPTSSKMHCFQSILLLPNYDAHQEAHIISQYRTFQSSATFWPAAFFHLHLRDFAASFNISPFIYRMIRTLHWPLWLPLAHRHIEWLSATGKAAPPLCSLFSIAFSYSHIISSSHTQNARNLSPGDFSAIMH